MLQAWLAPEFCFWRLPGPCAGHLEQGGNRNLSRGPPSHQAGPRWLHGPGDLASKKQTVWCRTGIKIEQRGKEARRGKESGGVFLCCSRDSHKNWGVISIEAETAVCRGTADWACHFSLVFLLCFQSSLFKITSAPFKEQPNQLLSLWIGGLSISQALQLRKLLTKHPQSVRY